MTGAGVVVMRKGEHRERAARGQDSLERKRWTSALKKVVANVGWTLIFAPLRQLRLMADIANKYPENIAGKYYVDDQCIDCDLCRETAPANFTRNDDGGHSYVFKQPESDEEANLCKEAMEGCPVEAIGSDGA